MYLCSGGHFHSIEESTLIAFWASKFEEQDWVHQENENVRLVFMERPQLSFSQAAQLVPQQARIWHVHLSILPH
eukprot:1905177-Amphidinium_carterae.1